MQSGRAPTEEEVITAVLYPKVYNDYLKFTAEFGRTTVLPSSAFCYGMGVGEVLQVDGHAVKLNRVSMLKPDGTRDLTFTVDGAAVTKSVKDQVAAGPDAFDGPMADAANPKHVASPMSGQVTGATAVGGSLYSLRKTVALTARRLPDARAGERQQHLSERRAFSLQRQCST